VEEPRDSSDLLRLLFERSEEATAVHAKASSSRIMRRLTALFPSELLEEYAEELSVVERK